MNRQSFSEKNLKETLWNRRQRSKSVSKKNSYDSLEDVAKKISEGNFNSTPLHTYNINKKPIYCTNSIEDEAVFSKLNENIKHIYHLKQSDRHTIVKQVIALIKEQTPKYIYKIDLSEFYKSVNADECIKKIQDDNVISAESKMILDDFSRSLKNSGIEGLPRGIGLSATLSELAIRPFDFTLKANSKIYYYSRFVDDIIIFSTDRVDIKREIVPHLPEGININWKKCKTIQVHSCFCSPICTCRKPPCKCWDKCNCLSSSKNSEINFSFLGYSFTFPNLALKNKNVELKVDISKEKVKKIKRRIFLSFKDYYKKGNYKLLENRIKFLSGNHYIGSEKHKTERMKSGTYYNYIHINTINTTNKTKKTNTTNEYMHLDKFLQQMIHTPLSRKISLTDVHKELLKKYSFTGGFEKKYVKRFSGNQVNKIKGCWNNG